jgi:hypothetical protein
MLLRSNGKVLLITYYIAVPYVFALKKQQKIRQTFKGIVSNLKGIVAILLYTWEFLKV